MKKLSKELSKEGFRNLSDTISHMLVFNIVSLVFMMIQYIGTVATGEMNGTGFISVPEYRVNLVFVIFSYVLLIIAFSVFYSKFLKKDIIKQINTHWIFVLLFLVLIAIFVFVEIVLYALSGLITVGLFSSFENYPYIVLNITVTYIVVYILLDIIIFWKEYKIKN